VLGSCNWVGSDRLVYPVLVGIQGILMGDLEKQLSLKIRTIFEDRNRDRLFFTIREVSHAWVDIFVEAFKPTLIAEDICWAISWLIFWAWCALLGWVALQAWFLF